MSSIAQNQVNLWIEQSRNGDREAFARIVELFQAKVCAVTFSMTGNLQESEDLAQETFLTAWNKLVDLREPEKIGAWLCGIARMLCKKWLHGKTRDPLHAAAQIETNNAEPLEIEESAPEKRQKQAELAWTAIAEIPEQYREPLILYYRENRSVREVAETLELTETCVKQRLHRGRQYLKEELQRLVETALESTRPDTAFTLAVLASLPLAATASGCSVSGGTATGIGTVTAGSQSGWSLLWSIGFFLLAPILLITGGFWGLGTALKHSPTVRTRRFMCRAALQWYLFIWLFMIVKLQVDHGHGGWNQSGGVFFFSFYVLLIAYCFWLVSRWRTLLEEDAGLRSVTGKPLEKSSLSRFWLRCWYGITMLPTVILSWFVAGDIVGEFLRSPHFEEYFGIWAIPFLVAVAATWMSVPIGFFFIIGYGLRTAKNEETLRKWYPRDGKVFLPKPEETTNRTVFGFDLGAMFTTTIVPMIFLIMHGLMINGLAAWVLISTMMMTVATMIASHSAGIPDKRLAGYAKLWTFAGLAYAAMLMTGRGCYFMIPIGFDVTIALQIVFCFVYFGAAAMVYGVARKQKKSSIFTAHS